MRDAAFHFLPLRKKKKIESTASVTITKMGTMRFNYSALLNLGIDADKGTFIRLFADIEKRTVGFQLTTKVTEESKDWRFLKPVVSKNGGNPFATLSIHTFLSQIQFKGINMPNLEVKRYKDPIFDVIHYIKIPRKIDDEKEEE
jgi:hypothetical protein